MAELPPVIRIEPASACNLRCTHCPTGTVRMRRGVMTPRVFDRVIEEVSKRVPPIRAAVLYHGGEPFLNPRFLDMVGAVKATGLPLVKTVSNGMLLGPERWAAVAASELDELEVSLDGLSPARNDEVRVNSDYHQVVANVRGLLDEIDSVGRGPTVSIATTQFRDVASASEASAPAHLVEAFAGYVVRFKATWAVRWPNGEPSSGYDVDWEERPAATSCSLLDDTLTVRASGDVVPCCYDLTTMAPLGNILDASLEDIWNGQRYRQFRSDFTNGQFPPLCAGCAVVTGPQYLIPRRRPIPVEAI